MLLPLRFVLFPFLSPRTGTGAGLFPVFILHKRNACQTTFCHVSCRRVADGFNGAYRCEDIDRRCTQNDYNNCKQNLNKTYVYSMSMIHTVFVYAPFANQAISLLN